MLSDLNKRASRGSQGWHPGAQGPGWRVFIAALVVLAVGIFLVIPATPKASESFAWDESGTASAFTLRESENPMDEPMIVEVSRERLGSIAEAQTKASFSILAPANLPSGTQVDEVHYGVWPGHEGQRGFDWVWIYYLRADGKRFAIRQGNVAGVVIDEATPPSAHGVVAVPGHPSATWLNGKPTMAADGHHVSGWEPGLLSLGWKPTQDLDSDLPRTLVIMASDDDFELGDLVAIASLIR